MKIVVECPVCENRFSLESSQVSGGSTKCELCNNSFDVKSNRLQTPEPVAQAITPASQQPKAAPQIVATEPVKPIAQKENRPGIEVAKSTHARAMLRRKKSPLVPILLGLATLASAVALIAVVIIAEPFKQSTPSDDDLIAAVNDTEADSDDPSTDPSTNSNPDNQASNATGQGTIFRTDGQSDEIEEPPTNAPPDKPPKSPTFRYLSKKDVEKMWDNQFWHFVRLRVKVGEKSHYVSGTIVDSRGWVATSLDAVANADEIEVQLADKNLREFNGIRLDSTDLVRGVIKTDPENDLVLLAINRKLVLSPLGVEFGSSENLVAAQTLVQLACPGTENWAWPTEAQLKGRIAYDEMDFDFQTQMDELALNKSDKFMIHGAYTDAAMGAALFNVEGQLIGINTNINDKSTRILAAPVEALVKLISSSSDNVMGLSTLTK